MHLYCFVILPGPHPVIMCNVICECSRGQSECVRSPQVTTHTVKNSLLRKHGLVMSAACDGLPATDAAHL